MLSDLQTGAIVRVAEVTPRLEGGRAMFQVVVIETERLELFEVPPLVSPLGRPKSGEGV